MVWMTMLERVTGSSGLPANETRGRRVEGGGQICFFCPKDLILVVFLDSFT